MAYTNISKTEEFEKEVMNSKDLVIVDFWAPWCGPCKMFGPVFQRVSDELKEIKFVKINIDEDESGDIAQRFNIMSIPAIVLFSSITIKL